MRNEIYYEGPKEAAGKRFIEAGKRGSEMMEAALVFPLVILAAIGLLNLTIGIFDEADGLAEVQLSEEKVYEEMEYARCVDAGKKGLQQYLSF